MRIEAGFDASECPQVAQMYWRAFGGKLGRVLGPDHRARRFIEDVMDPNHALCARDEAGQLLGVVGFKTHSGALVDGGWRDMVRHYGTIGAFWRVGLLALLERDTENERFLMDGIFVADAAQGQGVGTALLDAITDEAGRRGYREVRLDVIDSNTRARALYEREGFVAKDTQNLGLLKYVFGFESATTMVRQV
ncbi:MAG: GNAT family N-acetyltransferase [Pseudomonadota bacterium]